MPVGRKVIRRLAGCTMVVALSAGFTGCGGEIVLGDQTPPPSRTETIAELKRLEPAIGFRPGEDFSSDRLIEVCGELIGLNNWQAAADPPVLTERELRLLHDATGNCGLFPDAQRTLRRLILVMERRDAAQE